MKIFILRCYKFAGNATSTWCLECRYTGASWSRHWSLMMKWTDLGNTKHCGKRGQILVRNPYVTWSVYLSIYVMCRVRKNNESILNKTPRSIKYAEKLRKPSEKKKVCILRSALLPCRFCYSRLSQEVTRKLWDLNNHSLLLCSSQLWQVSTWWISSY